MKKGICDYKGELVDENLERFYKLWENAGKEVGAEERRHNWLHCVSQETEGLEAEVRTVVVKAGGSPHPLR